MKKITILSGKGGVGKSTLTASLAVLLAKKQKIVVADCDVDAPNLSLIFGVKRFKSKERIQTSEKARVIAKECPKCKKLIGACSFGAISWDKKNNRPIINKFLCEGCGLCLLVFPEGTVTLDKVENATIGIAKTDYGFYLVTGELEIGESGSGKIITAVKDTANEIGRKENAEYMIIDSSPGIGCPVISSIHGSDYVIAITEPTPSAMHDLQRVLRVVEHFKVPYGIVINKWDINKKFTTKIENFASRQGIKVLGKLPYDKVFVKALVNLKPVVIFNNRYVGFFKKILNDVVGFMTS